MNNTNKNVICYYRVSTVMQKESGLGLEAQKNIIERYCKDNNYNIIEEFSEIESGGKVERKILAEVIEKVKKTGCILMVAKIDRLTRDLDQLRSIMKSDINFIAVDNPTQDKFILSIYGALAEKEREMIGRRTKDALAAKKIRGEHVGRLKGSTRKDEDKFYKNLAIKCKKDHKDKIEDIKHLLISNYYLPYEEQIQKLTEYGFRTSKGSIPKIDTLKKYIKLLEIDDIIKNDKEKKSKEEFSLLQKIEEKQEKKSTTDLITNLREKYTQEEINDIINKLKN